MLSSEQQGENRIRSQDQFRVERLTTEKRKSRESVLNSEMDLMPIFCEV